MSVLKLALPPAKSLNLHLVGFAFDGGERTVASTCGAEYLLHSTRNKVCSEGSAPVVAKDKEGAPWETSPTRETMRFVSRGVWLYLHCARPQAAVRENAIQMDHLRVKSGSAGGMIARLLGKLLELRSVQAELAGIREYVPRGSASRG